MNMRRTIGVASFLALLLPANAHAQAWLKDRAASEGSGVKTGNLEVHPGIGTEVGYDSNWFLRSSSTDRLVLNGEVNGLPVVGLPVLRITPSISLSTLSGDRIGGIPGDPPKFKFRVSGAATYREYLSGDWSNQRNVAGALNADLQIAPAAAVWRGYRSELPAHGQRHGQRRPEPCVRAKRRVGER